NFDDVQLTHSGIEYQYDVKAIDPDSDPVTYALDTSPPGMTIDATGGRILWSGPSTDSTVTGPPPTDGLTLTPQAAAAGFSLTDFVSGFATVQTLGPIGIAFPEAAAGNEVIVTDVSGNVFRFATDADGQTVAGAQVLANLGYANAVGMAQLNGQLYMT